MGKLIDQQVAIDAVEAMVDKSGKGEIAGFYNVILERVIDKLIALPSAQSEASTDIQEILNYLDTTLHQIVSPDNWSVYAELYDMVSALPSAQPESNWIPVSERMPEDGENCLVSVRCLNNFLVDRGTYSTDLSKVDEENFFGERGKSGWYYINSEYGYCRILNVIAWMPLPEPYRAERRTDERTD